MSHQFPIEVVILCILRPSASSRFKGAESSTFSRVCEVEFVDGDITSEWSVDVVSRLWDTFHDDLVGKAIKLILDSHSYNSSVLMVRKEPNFKIPLTANEEAIFLKSLTDLRKTSLAEITSGYSKYSQHAVGCKCRRSGLPSSLRWCHLSPPTARHRHYRHNLPSFLGNKFMNYL